jgi:hypothetical protein
MPVCRSWSDVLLLTKASSSQTDKRTRYFHPKSIFVLILIEQIEPAGHRLCSPACESLSPLAQSVPAPSRQERRRRCGPHRVLPQFAVGPRRPGVRPALRPRQARACSAWAAGTRSAWARPPRRTARCGDAGRRRLLILRRVSRTSRC